MANRKEKNRKTKGRRRPRRKPRGIVRRETQRKVAQALSRMRQQTVSLAQAARMIGVSPKTIRRLAGSALRKNASGRYSVRPNDRVARTLRILAADGIRDVTLRHSKDARRLGEYWNAVHAYLAKGDASRLDDFRGQHVTTTDGERIPLLTDRATLDVLGSAGVLSFESMYAKAV